MADQFSESDIRPTNFESGQKQALEQDIEWLLERKDNFVRVSCPACGSDRSQTLFHKYGLTYRECDNCETLYISPRPTEKILEEFYKNSKNYAFWAKYIYPQSEKIRKTKIVTPRVQRISTLVEEYGISKNKIVEVGAGFGTFGQVIVESGEFNNYYAVEPTPDLARECEAKGLNVIMEPIEKAHLEVTNADVVVSFEVIEHLFNPQDFIIKCTSLMGPNSLLILTCPNWKGFETQVLMEGSDTFDAEHLNYFSPSSMKLCLESLGLEVLKLFTPGEIDLDIVKSKIEKGFEVKEDKFIQYLTSRTDKETLNNFQRFLQKNNLSTHMWVAAKKIDL